MAITYSTSAFPAWATLSASGTITVLPTAPAGSYLVTINAFDGIASWTKQVVLSVAPRQAQQQWFTVSTAAPRRVAFKLTAQSSPAAKRPAVAFKLYASAEQPAPAVAFKLTAISNDTQ